MLEQNFPAPTLPYTEARRLAEERLRPSANGEAGFPREAWDGLARFGFLRMPFPQNQGGDGLGPDELCDVLEGLGAGGADNGLLLAAGAHLWSVARPVADFGTPAQQDRWLPGLLDGRLVGAHAATEPGAGSDVMAMATSYRKEEGGYRLEGTKTFVSNAPVADLFVVFATADPRLHFRGVSAFLVERGTPGLSVGPAEAKMGLEASPLAEVRLDGCLVPVDSLLGREKRGAQIFRASLAWERTFLHAHQVGAMRRQVERAIEHVRERRQFGEPLAGFQAVSHRIVDIFRTYWRCRLVLRMAAAELVLRNEDRFAPLAKLEISEGALAVHMDALRTFGGAGYMRDLGLEREVRDALGGTIYSGTSDIQKVLLAATLGL